MIAIHSYEAIADCPTHQQAQPPSFYCLPTTLTSSSRNSCSANIDWDNVEHIVMGWFDQRKISRGHPQELLEGEGERQRKSIARKTIGLEGEKHGLLARRLGRMLTISL